MSETENFTFPPQSAEWVLTQLLRVAKTGVAGLKLGSPAAEMLASTIASIVKENEYLKKILGSRVIVTPEDKKISIAFGPAHRCVLEIPVNSDDEKREVAAALADCAAKMLYELANPTDVKPDAN